MSGTSENSIEECEVCDRPVDTETNFSKHDPRAPVYADNYVYHLGCEEEGVFEWSVGLDTTQETNQ